MRRWFPTSLVVLAAAWAAAADLAALNAPDGAWCFRRGELAIDRCAAVNTSWRGCTRLAFRARLSHDTLHTVHLLAYLVNEEGHWYQTTRMVTLETARAKAVALDMGPGSGDWVPRGHLRPWDARATEGVRLVGLKALCDGAFVGSVIVEGTTASRAAAPARARLQLLDFRAPRRVRVRQRCEVAFRLPGVVTKAGGPVNPFDPRDINVQGLFSPPGGGTDYRLVPGFYSQRHYPRWEGETKRYVPAGPAEWVIRFWPDRAGRHTCTVLVHTPQGEARVPWAFEVEPAEETAVKPGPAPGFRLRVSPVDGLITRAYNGRDPIYIHRPGGWRTDGRTPPKGDLRAWRAPIEWTARWGGYGGLGRLNLTMASQLDDVLDAAQARGIALPLSLTCDEPFGERAKYNWKDNPLNRANGGPLEAPSTFYTSSDAWLAFQNRVRYTLARWGGHPAVASWELWCTVPANGADLWHARAGEYLATWHLGPKDVRSHHPQTMPPASFSLLNTFQQREMEARSRWMAHTVIRHSAKPPVASTARATEGKESLEVIASYPGEAAIVRPVEADWHTFDRLALDVFVPKGAPNDMRVLVYLRDGDLWWYESLLPAYLRPGDWTKLLVDLSGETTAWTPRGHEKTFDRYALQRVRVIGLRVFGHRPYQGPVYIDNIQLWHDPAPRRRLHVKVLDVKANAEPVPRLSKFELRFRLSETFANPFDPEVVDIRGVFTAPGGAKASVPAFFDQDYERHLTDGHEVLTPRGRPHWALRFTPAEAGPYTYTVTLNGKALPALSNQTFLCVASGHTGFVRRSKADPRYFELSTGQFFYPIGMNLRSPSDNRKPYDNSYALPEGKGTFIYDEYYKKLTENGMNWARVWQCPWWCGLEWTRKWPGFHGLGRYNLESAWRFDYVLEQAARRGIYVQVCLTNHGQITIERNIDRQWDSNPLNAELGEDGPLRRAADFYTDARAKKLFRQRLRYIVARWGYSPNLMAWALFSEMEFTEAYWRDAGGRKDDEGSVRCPVVAQWVGEMAAHLKSIDPFGHLVTTHFSHPWRGFDVWSRPELDLVQSNAYSAFQQLGGDWDDRSSGDVARAVDRYYERYMERFNRPVLIAEFGGHWMRNPADRLDAELHAGTWAAVTSHLAGATGFWWWLHVHFTDQYHHYRAAARFVAGEDRRGQNLRQDELTVEASGGRLRARVLRNDNRAYAWVYDRRVVRSLDGIPAVDGARLRVPGLATGTYAVEFWDTYKGAVTGRAELECKGGSLRVDLPTVKNDIALKIRRR